MCRENSSAHNATAAHTAGWRTAVATALHGAGLRQSLARNAVLDWIAAASGPFTAEAIVQQLVGGWSLGSRPTVYRTVDWLRTAGWLARLHLEGSDRAYVRSLPGGHPLVCTGCGEVQTLLGLELTPLLEARLGALGFELRGHHLELYGRCRRCRPAIADGYDPYLEEDSHR